MLAAEMELLLHLELVSIDAPSIKFGRAHKAGADTYILDSAASPLGTYHVPIGRCARLQRLDELIERMQSAPFIICSRSVSSFARV